MGKKTRVAKASLAAAFVAAGGAAATSAQAAANPIDASLDGVISSYYGPLGLRDDFQHYLKLTSGFQNFDKWYKETPAGAIRGVLKFSALNQVPPPPGFGEVPGETG